MTEFLIGVAVGGMAAVCGYLLTTRARRKDRWL